MPLMSGITEEEKRYIIHRTREELIRRAVDQRVVTTKEEAIVRDMKPTDLDYATQVWEQSVVADAWTNTYTPDPTTKRLFAFYGVRNAAALPLTTAIRFGLGAGPAVIKDEWEVESAWIEDNTEGITNDIIIYDKEDRITIAQYSTTTGTDKVVLLGLVCEKSGETVVH